MQSITSVYFEIINRCNLNCITCYNSSGKNLYTKYLTTQDITHTINKLIPMGLNRVLLSGGEPLLHPDIHNVLSLPLTFPNLSFGIVTNATTQHQVLHDFIRKFPDTTLQISLDGSCEAVNAKTRGNGNFNKAISFVKNIPDISRLSQPPRLKMVISALNLHDVQDFYTLAISLHCIPEFAFVYKSGNADDDFSNKMDLSFTQKINTVSLIQELNEKFNTDAFIPGCSLSCPMSSDNPQYALCVRSDGAIQPCSSLYHDQFSLADISSLNTNNLLNALRQVSLKVRARATVDYGCKSCILASGCKRGCMAGAFQLHGDPLAPDEQCNLRKTLFIKQIKS